MYIWWQHKTEEVRQTSVRTWQKDGNLRAGERNWKARPRVRWSARKIESESEQASIRASERDRDREREERGWNTVGSKVEL